MGSHSKSKLPQLLWIAHIVCNLTLGVVWEETQPWIDLSLQMGSLWPIVQKVTGRWPADTTSRFRANNRRENTCLQVHLHSLPWNFCDLEPTLTTSMSRKRTQRAWWNPITNLDVNLLEHWSAEDVLTIRKYDICMPPSNTYLHHQGWLCSPPERWYRVPPGCC